MRDITNGEGMQIVGKYGVFEAVHEAWGRMRLYGGLSLLAILLVGCSIAPDRNAVPLSLVDKATVPGLTTVRSWGDEVPRDIASTLKARLPNMGRLAEASVRENGHPVVNVLALSGGGSDGAFGAGVLTGWSQAGTRPVFQVVTGISAGALVAPFAYLGTSYDRQLIQIWTQHNTEDLVQTPALTGLFGGVALADNTPMASLIAKYVDRRLLDRIATEYRNGRMLLIGTHNLDAQRFVVWNMGEIAVSRDPRALELFRQVILASASIPGVFPPVRITVSAGGQTLEELHVDGGISKQVFVAPVQLSFREFDRFYAAPPVLRFYVIRNGKLSPEYEVVQASTFGIAVRSLGSLTKSQGLGDIFEIYTAAKRDGAEFNLAAIPADFQVPSKEVFDPTYMRALFALGVERARRGYPWMKAPPELNRLKPSH